MNLLKLNSVKSVIVQAAQAGLKALIVDLVKDDHPNSSDFKVALASAEQVSVNTAVGAVLLGGSNDLSIETLLQTLEALAHIGPAPVAPVQEAEVPIQVQEAEPSAPGANLHPWQ